MLKKQGTNLNQRGKMPHKQELTEQQKELLRQAHSRLKPPMLGTAQKRPSMSDHARRERNRKKAASKIPLMIIPLPGHAGNPKKNKAVRRKKTAPDFIPTGNNAPRRGIVSQLCTEQKSSGNRRDRRRQAKLFIKNPLGLGHT